MIGELYLTMLDQSECYWTHASYMKSKVSLSIFIPVCKTMNIYILLKYNLNLSIISQDKELGLADKELKNDWKYNIPYFILEKGKK